MSRRADAIVPNLVIERVRMPDAALVADRLLSAATARPRLAGIVESFCELE